MRKHEWTGRVHFKPMCCYGRKEKRKQCFYFATEVKKKQQKKMLTRDGRYVIVCDILSNYSPR